MREIPIFVKSQFLENHMGRALDNISAFLNYRSELKPVAAPASEDILENQNQVVAERKKSGGASGISTLFVNLTRKPSRVARNFRKKSKAPPPPTSQPPSNPGPSTSAAEEEGETKTGIFLRYIKRIFMCG